MTCAVCIGSGRYPIITATGKELYTIACPECGGSGPGLTDDEAEAEAEKRHWQEKYDDAMRAKRPSAPQ
jgi:DnaJ-class molecular chaperone